MSVLNQKEATYQAIVNVCGVIDGKCEPTREQRAQVNVILFQGFRSGMIQLDREFNDSELKSYVSGLVSNWLRKDKRLNGDVKYEPKNPGVRTGHSDPQIRAMRLLLETTTNQEDKVEIQKFIDKRVAELKPKPQSMNINDLPPELIAKYIKGRG